MTKNRSIPHQAPAQSAGVLDTDQPARSRLLYLVDTAFDDCIELLDGVISTLHNVEEELRYHFSPTREPISESLILGKLKLARAGCRTVSSSLLEAEADSDPER